MAKEGATSEGILKEKPLPQYCKVHKIEAPFECRLQATILRRGGRRQEATLLGVMRPVPELLPGIYCLYFLTVLRFPRTPDNYAET
jgi:hypothetical protein